MKKSFMREAILRANHLSRSHGFELVRYPATGSRGELTRRIFSFRQVDCAFDVGAFTGGYVDFLRSEVGFDGPVVSFEPTSSTFAKLQDRWGADHRWRGFNYALGSENGMASLHTSTHGDLNSIRSASEYGRDRWRGALRQGTEEQVQVVRLADVFEQVTQGLKTDRVFMKVDTQGLDMEVIEGALPVLDRVVALQTEIAVKHLYESTPGWTDALERLSALNFVPAGLYPACSGEDGLEVVEFDCIMVRRH